MGKELRNVLGRTSAVQLRLSVDHRCPRYEGKASKRKGKGKYKEKRGAVEAGRSVIRSRVSCGGG
jgi:phage head maturation protease